MKKIKKPANYGLQISDAQKIFGVKIDNGDLRESLKKFELFLDDSRQHLIFTPNPEILNYAYKDKNYCKILNKASLSLPDGIGLVFMIRILGQKLKRLAGVDFLIESLDILERRNKRVFLLGSDYKTLRKAIYNLKQIYPNLIISGFFEKFEVGERGESKDTEKAIFAINNFKPIVIYVGLGHPKQEFWLYKNLNKIPSVKIGMGVGGSFDLISGKIKRAPKFIQNAGMEWFWRLIQEPWRTKPKRLKRIINAAVVFPIRAIKEYKNHKS